MGGSAGREIIITYNGARPRERTEIIRPWLNRYPPLGGLASIDVRLAEYMSPIT